MMNASDNPRYQRQSVLPGFGLDGQQKLNAAKVLVTGAGGLGCPALQYLAAAGVGTIGLADDDVVSLSNLQRQILYGTADIGRPKAIVAAAKLRALNPEITILSCNEKMTTANAFRLLRHYDIVIDGTDNFASRYLINDACVLLEKPLIYGAVSQYEGQVAVFNVADANGVKVNYRHLFPEAPDAAEVMNCADAGVLGVLAGIIGTMQAAEAIKLITGIGKPLINTVLTYNVLSHESFSFHLHLQAISGCPEDESAFLSYNYEWFCHAASGVEEIDAAVLQGLLCKENIVLIDVREQGELPEIKGYPYGRIPLSLFKNKMDSITGDKVVMLCQSGARSLQAAKMLAAYREDSLRIYSLKGGIQNAGFLQKIKS